jgi:uncharacterized protein YhaN
VRFLRLDLTAFGPFTDQSLTFSAEPALELVFGPNEAGKSSALRAIEGFLHGIPERTADAFLHRMPALRVGAVVADGSGDSVEFIRRKGRKDTLRDGVDRPVDEDALQSMCGGITGALFETAFGIDQDRLRKGAQEILAGGGDVGRSLFGAGLGAGVQDVLQTLEGEADQIYKARASRPDLNAALRRYDEARKAVRQHTLKPDVWTELDGKRGTLEERSRVLAEEKRGLLEERGDLERRRELLPLLTELDALTAEKVELGGEAILPPEAPERRRRAEDHLTDARPRLSRLEEKLRELRTRKEGLLVPESLLDRAEEIDQVQDDLGAHRKAQGDRPRLRGELKGYREAVRTALRRLGRDEDPVNAPAALVDVRLEARVKKLAPRHATLAERRANHEEQLRGKRAELERTRAAAAELPADEGDGELTTALRAARKGGDLEERIANLRRDEQRRARRFERQLSTLGLWSGAAAELAGLELPTEEAVRVHRQREAKLSKAREKFEEGLAENEERRSDCRRRIAEAEAGREIPSEKALRSARDRREVGWSLVRRAWLDGEDVAEEAGVFDPGRELPEAYERSVESADGVADGLRAEADRVAKLAALRAEHDQLEEKRDRLEQAREESEQARASDLAEWRALWEPAGIDPLSPEEMAGWLVRHARLVEELELLEGVRGEREEHEQRARLLAGGLASALGETADRSLDEWIAIAEQADDENRWQRSELRRLRKREEELDRETQELDRALEGVRADLDAWRADWAEAMLELGLDHDAEPEEAEAVLGVLAELRVALDKVRSHEERIHGIDEDAEAFAATVRAVQQACAPDDTALPVEEGARQLRRRLDEGREARNARSDVEGQIEEKETELGEAREKLEDAERVLAELVLLADVEGPEGLPAVEERSQRVRVIDERASELRMRIREVSRQQTLDEARSMIVEVDEAGLETRLEEIDVRLTEIEPEWTRLHEEIGETRKQLEQMDGTSQAAEDAAMAEEELARIRRLTERYALVRLASHVLEQEIEAYRREHQDPILERASEIFERVTLGAFSRLMADRDEQGNPLLLCVRPDGTELGVAALSEGSRDQLYFALRLAAVEHHVSRNEPIPFVVDDVFVNFDDDRARAGLTVLGELAERTQVLFFTHHSRLRELAEEALGGRCHKHELPAAATASHV